MRLVLVFAVGLACAASGFVAARAQDATSGPAAVGLAVQNCARPLVSKPKPRVQASAGDAGVQVYVTCEALALPAGASAPQAASAIEAASEPASAAKLPRADKDRGASLPAPSASELVSPSMTRRDQVLFLAGTVALLLCGVAVWIIVGAIEPELFRPKAVPDYPASTSISESINAPTRTPEGFTFRRHWGSFGGESTGWNMSSRLMRLLSGIAIAAMGAWLILRLLAATDPPLKAGSNTPAETRAGAVATVPK